MQKSLFYKRRGQIVCTQRPDEERCGDSGYQNSMKIQIPPLNRDSLVVQSGLYSQSTFPFSLIVRTRPFKCGPWQLLGCEPAEHNAAFLFTSLAIPPSSLFPTLRPVSIGQRVWTGTQCSNVRIRINARESQTLAVQEAP